MCLTLANAAEVLDHRTAPTPAGGFTCTSHHAGHLAPGDMWRPEPTERPRTVTEASQTERVDGLRWFSTEHREIRDIAPDPESIEATEGHVLPVLMLIGPDAGELSGKDQCPSCGMADGIRFLGSAVATQLSVTLSNLFGATCRTR